MYLSFLAHMKLHIKLHAQVYIHVHASETKFNGNLLEMESITLVW